MSARSLTKRLLTATAPLVIGAAALTLPGALAADTHTETPAQAQAGAAMTDTKEAAPLIPRDALFGNPTKAQGRLSPLSPGIREPLHGVEHPDGRLPVTATQVGLGELCHDRATVDRGLQRLLQSRAGLVKQLLVVVALPDQQVVDPAVLSERDRLGEQLDRSVDLTPSSRVHRSDP